MPPMCRALPMPQKVISSCTFSVLALADSSISGCTGISDATPHRPRARTLSPWRAAQSSATSAPIEWPTRAACLTPASSISRAVQSAIAATLANGAPSDQPWPGKSTASTRRPRWANQRVCRRQTVRSKPAAWRKTTAGPAGLAPTLDVEGEDRAGARGQQLLGKLMVGMVGQLGRGDAFDGVVLGQEGDDLARILDMARDAQWQGLETLQQVEGVLRRQAA